MTVSFRSTNAFRQNNSTDTDEAAYWRSKHFVLTREKESLRNKLCKRNIQLVSLIGTAAGSAVGCRLAKNKIKGGIIGAIAGLIPSFLISSYKNPIIRS